MKTTQLKIKVLYIITKSNWGGAQKYVYQLATNLDSKIFEPIVALGGNGVLADKLRDAGIRVVHLPSLERDVNPLRDFASFRDLLHIMREERPDAVHLNSSKIGGIGSIAGQIAGVPRIIFTAHGWAFNEDRSLISRLVIKLLYLITIRLSDVTIAVSKAVALDAPAWGMQNKVIVIHLPAYPEDALPDKKTARLQLAKKIPSLGKETRLWIGIVAELHKNKGIAYAIDAMMDAGLQNKAVLVIIGAGQEEAVLNNKIRALGLEDSVYLVGFEPEAAKLMPAFDIFLLPSTTEAFGYVLLEAGFAGLPVVASNVGGVPEIIKDEKTGLLVKSRSPHSIREALFRIIDNPTLGAKLAATLQARVHKEFSPRAIISKTAKLYKRI
jgi:glycosyltransferase involved in cell wall biosynthesis